MKILRFDEFNESLSNNKTVYFDVYIDQYENVLNIAISDIDNNLSDNESFSSAAAEELMNKTPYFLEELMESIYEVSLGDDFLSTQDELDAFVKCINDNLPNWKQTELIDRSDADQQTTQVQKTDYGYSGDDRIPKIDISTIKQVNGKYVPKTKDELIALIRDHIDNIGYNCSLNDIDTSKITDMSELFVPDRFNKFTGDLSEWDVSHVTNMDFMFRTEVFMNCDLSKWNVSKVKSMRGMFQFCEQFNCDLSNWNVSNVKDMSLMFQGAKRFNGNISNWDVSNVETMEGMFGNAQSFDQDISSWDVSNVDDISMIFDRCPLKDNIEKQPNFNDLKQPKFYGDWK